MTSDVVGRVALLLALCLSHVAIAAPSERDYFAARDEGQARFAKFDLGHPPPTKEEDQDHEKALATLGTMLGALIGPSGVKGFSGAGVSTVSTLIPDLEFDQMDGLAWENKDLGTRLVVTTNGLLENWVASHRDLPHEISAALKKEELYSAGLVVDLHWEWYAEIPIRKPPVATFATAFVGLKSNDTGDYAPSGMAIAVVTPTRTYFFDVDSFNVLRIPACHAIWSSYEKKADAAFARYRASHLEAKNELQTGHDLEEAGGRALRACYAERSARQPAFQTLVKKAQALVDRIEAR